MKIGYVTLYDSTDVHNWSGTGLFIRNALVTGGHEVFSVGPVDDGFIPLWLRLLRLIEKKRGKVYLVERNLYIAKRFAKRAEVLFPEKCDLIFSPGSIPVAMINNGVPRVIYADATFGGMIGYYDTFKKLSKLTIDSGMKLDTVTFSNCEASVFASQWAAQSAISLHHADPSRVHVVPFGANLETPPDFETVRSAVVSRSAAVCNILFWGVDWERKRGRFTMKVVETLRKSGVDAHLHIVGLSTLPIEAKADYIVNHGFLSKKNAKQNAQLEKLLLQMHFLVLPTVAEAFGLVFAEASAYGIPSLAPRTGGVSSVIKEGRNGFLFDLEKTGPDVYAAKVLEIFKSQDRYIEIAISSRRDFDERLNWGVAGKMLDRIIREVVDNKVK
ncbi:MAG TPA: glycosyltransferase family 4 protein [Chitinispirillaceae bacterium]|nr:glycosyltransferase family 4 protein [Chitinispirillaceae bacterium]